MRFVWLCVLLGLGSLLPVQAQKLPADALNPKEIAQGWIRLFDGETTFGWTPRDGAAWRVADGALETASKGLLATNTEFGDFDLSLECWLDAGARGEILFRGATEGALKEQNAYEVTLNDGKATYPTGSLDEIARTKTRVRAVGAWTTLLVHAEGDHLTISANGKQTVSVRDTRFKRGVIALRSSGSGLRFRNIRLRPLGLKPIFNGKDLTGWTVLPGHASVYTVTPEGWLNVKKGNGEIQTTDQWGDFALQLEIFSNGDHLNSGVFFREEPGQFWAGYESQIRNQWEGEDRTKAVDYGTGGLYNRQPARKVVSSDREWFTMTVFTGGKHIAIWVNGYLTSDYTDNRPEDQNNARNGARTRAGVLGLQGHDPTTDLSFRDIRIVELPTAKP